jgi:hypothetical protein
MADLGHARAHQKLLLRLIVNYGVLPFLNEVEQHKNNFRIIVWKIHE